MRKYVKCMEILVKYGWMKSPPPAHSQQLKKDKTGDKKKFRNGTEL
jgi:hypothetical protein